MRKGILIFFCAQSFLLSSQTINLNFEQGNLTDFDQCPTDRWQADSMNPVSDSWSLHHNFDNLVAGKDVISYNHKTLYLDSTQTIWQFKIFYNYNPSSSNMWAVWLTCNSNACSMLPDGTANGYILGVNYKGSDDILRIWRQDVSGITEVLNTKFNWQTSVTSKNVAGLKVTRDIDGNWSVYFDSLSLGNFKFLATANDKAFTTSDYFGFYYKYTSTQDRKLWFDDFSLTGKFYWDSTPPELDSFAVGNRRSLTVWFNEEIDTANLLSFLLNNQYSPVEVNWQGRNKVTLIFQENFNDNTKISISNLSDTKGNVSSPIKMEFNYHLPQTYDVLITEIMADPSPKVGLPECEYLEILNNSAVSIDLCDWSLIVGEDTVKMPTETIIPGEYAIITDNSNASKFGSGKKVISISSMPALINSGALIQLRDDFGKLIYGINYSSNWYETEYKLEGGWSLEMIDTTNPCLDKQNWRESINPDGGTPGFSNSIAGTMADYYLPEVLSIQVIDSTDILVNFSEKMDSLKASNPENYTISDENISFKPFPVSPMFNQVRLILPLALQKGKIYMVNFSDGLTDCSGNHLLNTSRQFGLPSLPDSSDLVINEILFESTDLKPEFVELFNNTRNIVELKGLSLALIDEYTDSIQREIMLTPECMQILPFTYAVITDNKMQLTETYPGATNSTIIQPRSWLALSNEGGKLAIRTIEGNIIDEAIFNPKMHFKLINATAGISLERISPFVSGTSPLSWHSASSVVNYATPGEPNSQTIDSVGTNKKVSLSTNVFSPDNDGDLDFVEIQYNFGEPDYTVSITIYNQNGELVKNLADNEFTGTDGIFAWDGLDNNGNQLDMGYYIIYFQAVNINGNIVKEKKTVLLLPQKK